MVKLDSEAPMVALPHQFLFEHDVYKCYNLLKFRTILKTSHTIVTHEINRR
jgi:hypothetical protein